MGLDVRRRKIWSMYGPETILKESSIDPQYDCRKREWQRETERERERVTERERQRERERGREREGWEMFLRYFDSPVLHLFS